jgi:hypothetical protein
MLHAATGASPHSTIGGTVAVRDPASHLAFLRDVLKSQYHASLAMLRDVIEACPDDVWQSDAHRNRYWQIVYHVLFFTHLYLMPNEAAFVPWSGHRGERGDGTDGTDSDSPDPPIPTPYTKAETLAYWTVCDDMVDGAIDALDLDSPNSGFDWYPIPKLEHQIVNIRHIQHHTAQLADRLRKAIDRGTRWVGAGGVRAES